MPRFHFRLDPLLRLRRRAEESAREELGRTIAEEARRRAVLARLEEELDESIAEQRRSREGDIWVQGQILALGWNARRKSEIAEQMERIAQAVDAVKAAREALVEARRAVQILEKLRARRREQWALAERRKEQATLSDIAGIRWMRQRMEEGT